MTETSGNIKVTEIRSYVPLSHHYADLLANLAASIELCSATVELWEIWSKTLKDENSKKLIKRMVVITSRYLNNPQGRAFAIYTHTEKREFYEISEKIAKIKGDLEKFDIDKRKLSELEVFVGKLDQLAKNFRLEIQLLAKTETIEYSK